MTVLRSLTLNWRDDSPQEVRAPLHDLLHDALALIILLSRLVVALLQLRHYSGIELVIPY